MRLKNVLPSILLSIIVLNTLSYDMYANMVDYNECTSQQNIICNNNKGRRGSLTNLQNAHPNLQLLEQNSDTNDTSNSNNQNVTTNKKFKRSEIRTKSIMSKQISINSKLFGFNHLSIFQMVKYLNSTYPAIKDKILKSALYNMELKSIMKSLTNERQFTNNISLDDICDLLLQNYNKKHYIVPRLLAEPNILNDSIEKLQNIKIKLINYKRVFEFAQNTDNEILFHIMMYMKYNKANIINKIHFKRFITQLKQQPRKNLNHILFLKTQYEKIHCLDGILYIYSTLKSILSKKEYKNIIFDDIKEKVVKLNLNTNSTLNLLLENKENNNITGNDIIQNLNYNDIILKLDKFNLKISSNINGFYKDCLLGSDLPIFKNLQEIKTIMSCLESNPCNEDPHNNINIVSQKISAFDNNPNTQYIKSNLEQLNALVLEMKNNINFCDIKYYLKPINLILSKISNCKLVIPVNNNVLNWCEERYEDWADVLSDYEYLVTNKLRFEMINENLQKEKLYNMVNMFYKIAEINLQLENYHRIIKLLYNTSNILVLYKNKPQIFVY